MPPKKPEYFDVGGFKFPDAPTRWEIGPVDPEMTNLHALRLKFREEWRWFTKPISWARNPEKAGVLMFPGKDVIVSVYNKGFYIFIERSDMFGPHPARLYYRSWQDPTQFTWVAICQIEGMWHSDTILLRNLNQEIRNHRLWHSYKSAQLLVIA